MPQADQASAGDLAYGPGPVSGNLRATETGIVSPATGDSEGRDLPPGSEKGCLPLGPRDLPRLWFGFEVDKNPLYRFGICSSPNQPTIQGKPVTGPRLQDPPLINLKRVCCPDMAGPPYLESKGKVSSCGGPRTCGVGGQSECWRRE